MIIPQCTEHPPGVLMVSPSVDSFVWRGRGPQENTCIYALEHVNESVDMNVNVGVMMCQYAWVCLWWGGEG